MTPIILLRCPHLKVGEVNLPKKAHYVNIILMLTKRKKQNIIKKVQTHKTDTGSPEVQIAILTRKIEELASHLKKHTKDIHSRRGLMQIVADRRKHMNYLKNKSPQRYKKVAEKLNLKK